MFDALVWGMIAALSLGTADFLARSTSLRLGAIAAFTYVVIFGTLLMTAFVFITGVELRITSFGLVMSSLHGVFVTAMSIMLYAALARGPVSLVVPIVAAHPVLIILYEFATGTSNLSSEQTLAAVLVVIGVVAASMFSFHSDGGRQKEVAGANELKRGTVFLALAACIAYALLIITGQSAAAEIGQTSVALFGRATSAAVLLMALAMGVFKLPDPRPIILPLAAQGLLDTLGYIALLAGGLTLYPGITAVTGSMFGFLTIVLARIFIKEQVGLFQWASILLSFVGIAWLVWSN